MNSQTNRSKLLLIVDDNAIARRVLAHQLSSAGYEVEAAATGPIGLTTLLKRPVDLVLLDVVMEPLSGLEVLQRIRQQKPADRLPVLMMSGSKDADVVARATRLGANGFFVRPFQLQDLLARIEQHL